jgi:hypothetical protein
MAGEVDMPLDAIEVTPAAAPPTTAAAAAAVIKPVTRVFGVTTVLSIGPTELRG